MKNINNDRRINAFLRNIENWLAKPQTNDKIQELLNPINLPEFYRTFGYCPPGWKRGRAILNAELQRRQMEHDEKRPVRRKGEQVIYAKAGSLHKKRSAAGRQNRTVKDKNDRGKIKAAVLRKNKKGYTFKQACDEVARLCQENDNLLKLVGYPYIISTRSIRRIVKGS